MSNQAEIIKSLTKRITDLEASYDKLLKENTSLTNKVAELEKKEKTDACSPSKKLFSDLFKRNKTDKNVTETNIINAIRIERSEEEKKCKNVRFKRKETTTESTPLLIELNEEKSRIDILKRSKNLKDNETYNKVYITPDLTFAQRELNKKLVEKRNELNSKNDANKTGYRYGIRDYNVVKIKVVSQHNSD
ncbi:unnamed protein product [Brachionus calyciflorus]|uniref:Uncharacterized protein n=1 Tax=Brachionus calyciflorus TaxID=104777 RepID=A0A814B394_9BILA|nr:unnamed protein product [Brachionus calyciflorus]